MIPNSGQSGLSCAFCRMSARMNSRRLRPRFQLASRAFFFLALACSPLRSLAQAPAGAAAEEVRVAPGVVYRHWNTRTPVGEPWSIHVLEIDRGEKSVVLRSVVGHGSHGEMQRELPSEMAARAAQARAEVLAAVNGDYDLGAPYLGLPIGLAVTSGRLWTTGHRGAWPVFGLLESGEPVIGLPEVYMELSAGEAKWPMASLNKPFGFTDGSNPRLFAREYGAAVKGENPFRAVIIGKLKPALPLRVDSVVEGVVLRVQEHASELAIPQDAFVLAVPEPAAAKEAENGTSLAGLRRGRKVTLRIRVRLNGREPLREVVGGGPVLVENGHPKDLTTGLQMHLRHPRTAGCYNDRKIIFVVVDGRQPQLSVGMTYKELADLMVSLGCTGAMNFDGGGSSVMVVALPDTARGNATAARAAGSRLQIANSPSDGKERGRGNVWLVIRKH